MIYLGCSCSELSDRYASGDREWQGVWVGGPHKEDQCFLAGRLATGTLTGQKMPGTPVGKRKSYGMARAVCQHEKLPHLRRFLQFHTEIIYKPGNDRFFLAFVGPSLVSRNKSGIIHPADILWVPMNVWGPEKQVLREKRFTIFCKPL